MDQRNTTILNHTQIVTKLERIACEICERFSDETELVLCGINERGFFLAKEIASHVQHILPDLQTALCHVTARNGDIQMEKTADYNGKSVLVIDDVINTGSTLMGVVQAVFAEDPKGIYTAFLAKREHRNFPVKADFVGISLATTLQEHVVFDNSNPAALQVYLN